MCGIAVAISLGMEPSAEPIDLLKMTTAMRHRGPDDEGVAGFPLTGSPVEYYGADTPVGVRLELALSAPSRTSPPVHVALGHRRLSIIDVSPAGHQPMSYANERYWIVFNGEVYNYIELRNALHKLGMRFRSSSDTEVILAAYATWGTDCFKRFNGMWAMAIFDRSRQTLVLARDRFGIKPLYWCVAGNTLLFASEIKAILSHRSCSTSPNMTYLRDFLLLGALEYRSETAFTGIHRFPIASFACIDVPAPSGQFTTTRFWDYEPDLSTERFSERRAQDFAAGYYSLLKDAVRLRLRSDVPIGSALSGGLDSSSIVFLVRELLNEAGADTKQVTFSTTHRTGNARELDESTYIAQIAHATGAQAWVVEPDANQVPALHERATWCGECPHEGMGIPGMYVFGLAKSRGVRVTLDGQGADEQQAGYLHYFALEAASHSLLSSLVGHRRDLASLGANPYIRFGRLAAVARGIIGRRGITELGACVGRNWGRHVEPLNARLKADCHRNLVNLLAYSDGKSMFNSVESRMPFMDYRLVEYTASIPAAYKIHDGWTKYFARLAFSGRLPESIAWRRDKLGWPMPEEQWISGPLREWSQSLIRRSELVSQLTPTSLRPPSTKVTIRLLNLAQWERIFWTESSTRSWVARSIEAPPEVVVRGELL